ncbi:hypothetical protein [Hyphomicrobium sp.]|uniref:hypothetical protein n=1 Tax=Hyphomicrobium sp. TaxID=82 RepID=UPI0035660134
MKAPLSKGLLPQCRERLRAKNNAVHTSKKSRVVSRIVLMMYDGSARSLKYSLTWSVLTKRSKQERGQQNADNETWEYAECAAAGKIYTLRSQQTGRDKNAAQNEKHGMFSERMPSPRVKWFSSAAPGSGPVSR